MFNNKAFQQDLLVTELREAGIVKRTGVDNTSALGYVMLNHNRNENVRVEIRPTQRRPILFDYENQNPSAYVDPIRGYFGTCLRHADQFVITCTDATDSLYFNASFTQTILDLTRNNTNIVKLFINGIEYNASDFILNYGTTRTFNTAIFDSYGIAYTDQAGNYKLSVSNGSTARLEVRVKPNSNDTNDLPVDMVRQVFAQSGTTPNPTIEYHSNSEFYGFTACIVSTSMPSNLKVMLADQTILEQMYLQGKLDQVNLDATSATVNDLDETTSRMRISFASRLMNEFDEEIPLRAHNYLLDLGEVASEVNINNVSVFATRYSLDGDVIAPMRRLASNKIMTSNGRLLLADVVSEDMGNHRVEYTTDFDDLDENYLPYTHQLFVDVTIEPDVSIPVMARFAMVFPRQLTTFTNAVYLTHQYYQFGIDVEAGNILSIWSNDISKLVADFSVVNGLEHDVVNSNIDRMDNGSGITYRFTESGFAVIQLKLPIGTTGDINMVLQDTKQEFIAVRRANNGLLTEIPVAERNHIGVFARRVDSQNTDKTFVNYAKNEASTPRLSQKYFVQQFATMSKGQAIALIGDANILFTQYYTGLEDYDPRTNRRFDGVDFTAFTGRSYEASMGGVIETGNVPYSSNTIIYRLGDQCIEAYTYQTDENLVPILFTGKKVIPFAYDESKPVDFVYNVNSLGNKYLGTPYYVTNEELGPITSPFLTEARADAHLLNMIEVSINAPYQS